MITFKNYQCDNENFLGIDEGNSSAFTFAQIRQQAQQIQRQIQQTAKDIERTSNNDTKQLAKMLVKLTALIGLSLAQDTGDRRIFVRRNQ